MRRPYERFLVYLLLTGHTDKEVLDLFKSAAIKLKGNAYLERLRSAIRKKIPGAISDDFMKGPDLLFKFRRADMPQEWLDELEMNEAHSNLEGFDDARAIFLDRKKRNIINIYILCPDLVPERLMELYEEKFGGMLPASILDVYKKYFFDASLLNDSEWYSYTAEFDSKTRMLYEQAPVRKSKYIRWKMGDNPGLEPSEVTQTLMSDFFFLSQDAHLNRAENWQEDAVRFGNLALSASDRAAKHKRVVGKNMKMELLSLFEEEEEEFVSFDELDQGDEDVAP